MRVVLLDRTSRLFGRRCEDEDQLQMRWAEHMSEVWGSKHEEGCMELV